MGPEQAGMTGWVILFRGVGGATQLPTKPLREGLIRAGFGQVGTYINSGNAVLTSYLPREQVINIVAELCSLEFGFTKPIFALTAGEWAKLIDLNPFPEAVAAPTTLHAAVLASEPDPDRIGILRSLALIDDRIEVAGRVAYLHKPLGFGRSKLAERFDKGIGVPNTARNWTTVGRLMAMLREAAAQEGGA
jgi:uncharacterized protein (DUF1697 family)